MADTFQITPYKVRSAGTDVPPEEVQAAINSLAQQTQTALNTIVGTAEPPTGPAGGDLGGTYPNPTVVALHVTSGTESGVTVTGNTINSSPIGQTVAAAGTFTTAVAGSVFANGGVVPAVTSTATQIYNSPNPTVQFIDSIRSAGNKNAFITWGSTVLAFGVANDAFTSFTNALAITGGQASGISGITSTSGTGAWAHTGGFSATGGINSTAVGATTPSTGAFTTLSASSGVNSTNIGATTPGTGAFTTLSATSTVSGTGFTNLFASPPAIGSTAANTGAFTTLNASGNDALLYQNSSAQSIPNNAQTTVTTWTKVYDRVNANFNASTGTFTAPATGFYQVSGQLSFSSAAGVVGANYASAINVNGTIVTEGAFFQESTSTTSVSAPFSAVVSLTAGQTVVIQAFQSTGVARTLLSTNTFTYLSINRIP